jgi:predicted nucleotidyltransferase
VANSELTNRNHLLSEVRHFVERARVCPGVRRIALIGSLVTDKDNPKDADVLVTVDDDADLTQLATAGRTLKGHAQSRNKGADIFLSDPAGNYIGRICHGVSAALASGHLATPATAGGALSCTTILMPSCSIRL